LGEFTFLFSVECCLIHLRYFAPHFIMVCSVLFAKLLQCSEGGLLWTLGNHR
jgi:hypothetical protein